MHLNKEVAMGYYNNKGHFFDNSLFLKHEDGSDKKRAKYGTANSTTSQKGTDGKKNNSSEYNHKYYLENKEKWQIGYGEQTDGDPDFDDKNFTDENKLGDTNFFAVKGKDGSWTVLEENMKWKVPSGVSKEQLHKAISDISKKDKQKRMSAKEFASSVTKSLEGLGKSKKTEEKKEEDNKDSSKKSGSSSGKKSSGGSSKKSSGGKGKKSSGSKKKSSDDSSKKSSSSGSKKKSSSGSKKSSSAKTEEEKKAEEEKKTQEQQKMQQEAEAYQKQLAEQQAQKEAQQKEEQKQQEEQNATGSEYTEEELKKASKKTTKKKKLTKQNAQYAKHFDEHGAIIRYFDRRY